MATNVISIILVVVFATYIRACSDVGVNFTLTDKFNSAAVVVYGEVTARLKDTKYPYRLPNLFAATFKIVCIYKGHPQPSFINITGAGHVPGLCHHTRLKVGKKYVVLLSNFNGYLEPSSNDIEIQNIHDKKLKKIARICGASLEFPEGERSAKCPRTDNSHCLKAQSMNTNLLARHYHGLGNQLHQTSKRHITAILLITLLYLLG